MYVRIIDEENHFETVDLPYIYEVEEKTYCFTVTIPDDKLAELGIYRVVEEINERTLEEVDSKYKVLDRIAEIDNSDRTVIIKLRDSYIAPEFIFNLRYNSVDALEDTFREQPLTILFRDDQIIRLQCRKNGGSTGKKNDLQNWLSVDALFRRPYISNQPIRDADNNDWVITRAEWEEVIFTKLLVHENAIFGACKTFKERLHDALVDNNIEAMLSLNFESIYNELKLIMENT